jgi:hypothetical protein
VWVCRCTVCGSQVRGQHPEVAPDQSGSTAHRVGARLMAAAHALHYGMGIPVRKVPLVLGALTQDALQRTAGAVGMAYAPLRATVPETPVVHTDDTGWRMGGEPAHLLAFETETPSLDAARPAETGEPAQAPLPRGLKSSGRAGRTTTWSRCADVRGSFVAVI